MWVPSQDCPANECKGERYTRKLSNTYLEANDRISIKYGRGFVAGKLAEDTMAFISDPTDEGQVAKKMHFLNVFQAKDLTGLVADGLIGLSPKASPKQPSDIFVHELFQQQVIGTSMFSMYLGYEG